MTATATPEHTTTALMLQPEHALTVQPYGGGAHHPTSDHARRLAAMSDEEFAHHLDQKFPLTAWNPEAVQAKPKAATSETPSTDSRTARAHLGGLVTQALMANKSTGRTKPRHSRRERRESVDQQDSRLMAVDVYRAALAELLAEDPKMPVKEAQKQAAFLTYVAPGVEKNLKGKKIPYLRAAKQRVHDLDMDIERNAPRERGRVAKTAMVVGAAAIVGVAMAANVKLGLHYGNGAANLITSWFDSIKKG